MGRPIQMKSKEQSTVPCGTPEITFLYSLNWPSTTTVCSLFDKISVRILNKGPPTLNCLNLNVRALWITRLKAALKSRPTKPTSQLQSNAFWTKLVLVRRASQVPRPLQEPYCKFGMKIFFSAKVFKCFAKNRSKTLDKTGDGNRPIVKRTNMHCQTEEPVWYYQSSNTCWNHLFWLIYTKQLKFWS